MTHDDKVLALLSDGHVHDHHEIYGLHVVGHSRISSLRAKGHVIESWRDGDDYLYRLISSPLSEPSVASVSMDGSLSVDADPARFPSASDEGVDAQLTLTVAA